MVFSLIRSVWLLLQLSPIGLFIDYVALLPPRSLVVTRHVLPDPLLFFIRIYIVSHDGLVTARDTAFFRQIFSTPFLPVSIFSSFRELCHLVKEAR